MCNYCLFCVTEGLQDKALVAGVMQPENQCQAARLPAD
jgi:hypothetical protein